MPLLALIRYDNGLVVVFVVDQLLENRDANLDYLKMQLLRAQ